MVSIKLNLEQTNLYKTNMTTREQFKEVIVEYHLVNFHDESWQDISIQFSDTECKQIVDILKKNPKAGFSDIPQSIYNDVKSVVEDHVINEMMVPGLNNEYGITVELQDEMPEEFLEMLNLSLISKPVQSETIHMRCLAIRQPWASLIVTGIKDIECRNAMNPSPGLMLVAASGSKLKWEDLPRFVQETYLKYQKSGVLPEYKNLPKSAIIGYANIVKTTFGPVSSVWGRGHDGIKYILDDAHEFDVPITGKNKATPLFYNVEGIDEEHLPASHKVNL